MWEERSEQNLQSIPRAEDELPECEEGTVPECVEVKIAFDLAAVPVLGVPLYFLFRFIAKIKIGATAASNSFWLQEGSIRLWKITIRPLVIILAILSISELIYFIKEIYYPHHRGRGRVTTTRTNLETLRSCISMYYARTGTYPSDDLNTLVTARFNEGGREVTFLPEIPMELISTNRKESADKNPPNRRVYNKLGNEGGWFFDLKSGRVYINYNRPIGEEWGEAVAGQNPSRW